jgi:hypothetical protein
MQKEITYAVIDDAKRLDDLNYQVGDVLDVKASIILVVVTFLGTLSGEFLSITDLPTTIKIIQIVAVVMVSAAGILTLFALWPRQFDIPQKPEEVSEYVNALEAHFKGKPSNDSLVWEEFCKQRMDSILARIATNKELADSKARFNQWAFYALVMGILAQLTTLLWLAFSHLHL